MRKLIFILLLCLILPVKAQYSGIKPILGEQINCGDSLPKGLVGCWLMNEGAGSVHDVSYNHKHGTTYGTPTWDFGKFGSCMTFNGTTDYIRIIDGLTELFNEEATLIMWLKLDIDPPTDADKTGLVWGAGSQKATHYPYTDGNLYLSTFCSTTRPINAYDNSGFDKTKWHQIAITVRPGAGNYKFYQNGGLVTSGTGEASIANVDTNWSFGRNNAADYLDGQIDHVILWNRALSASEILDLYINSFCMFDDDQMEILQSATTAPSIVPTPYYYRAIPPIIILIPISLFAYFGRRKCAA